MSESDVPKIPPSAPPPKSLPASPAELRTAIIELRGELKAQRARETLEGEIVRINPDGTARIRTDKGEVTVAPPRGRDLPPEGTKVEIEILPGTPPRQALIRPAPETAPQEQPAPEKPAAAPARPPSATQEPARQQQTNPAPQESAGTPTPKPPPAPIPGQAPRLAAQTAQSLSGSQAPAAPAPPPAIVKPGDALRLRLVPVPPPPPGPEQPATAATPPPPAPQNTKAQPRIQPPPLQIPPGAPPDADPAPPPPPATTQNQTVPAKAAIPAPVITAQAAATVPPETGGNAPPPLPHTAPAEKTVTPSPATPSALSFDTLDIRITAILPPEPPPPAAKAGEPPPPQSPPPEEEGAAAPLIATVADSGSERRPPAILIRLPGEPAARRFALPFPAANLPPGTRIAFRLLPAAPPAPPLPENAAPQTTAPAPIPLPAFAAGPPPPGYIPWPAFEELAQTLLQAAPQTAQTLAGTVPSPAAPARLPAAALFFIAAVRSGDMAGWLGEKTSDTLRRIGKDDLPARLLRDSGALQPRTAADPPGEWRSASLPLLWDGHPHRLSLHYRGEESNNGEEGNDKKSATRFIFDLSLRRLGAVQLDGLHREGRIDLTVRTAAALGAPMQQTMRRRYSRALEEIGLSGDLSFQNRPEFFVKIAPPKAGQRS